MNFAQARESGLYNPAFIDRLEKRYKRQQAVEAALHEYDKAAAQQREQEAKEDAQEAECEALEHAKRTLHLFFTDRTRTASAKVILRCVSAVHGVSIDDIMSKSRKLDLVAARNDAYATMKWLRPTMSCVVIGQTMGKDHTTILHSLRKSGHDRGEWVDGFPRFSEPMAFLNEHKGV